jgi:hypothetical protein
LAGYIIDFKVDIGGMLSKVLVPFAGLFGVAVFMSMIA